MWENVSHICQTQWETGKNINQGEVDFRLKHTLLGEKESSEPLMKKSHHLLSFKGRGSNARQSSLVLNAGTEEFRVFIKK